MQGVCNGWSGILDHPLSPCQLGRYFWRPTYAALSLLKGWYKVEKINGHIAILLYISLKFMFCYLTYNSSFERIAAKLSTFFLHMHFAQNRPFPSSHLYQWFWWLEPQTSYSKHIGDLSRFAEIIIILSGFDLWDMGGERPLKSGWDKFIPRKGKYAEMLYWIMLHL